MKKEYICPACKKKQTSIAESQTGTQIYEYDFESKSWDIPSYGEFNGKHNAWSCPSCGQDLDIKKVLPKEVLKDLI